MRDEFDLLKRGSDAYNRDVADIKWLVSTLKGVLCKFITQLPPDFSFTADLYQEGDDHDNLPWAIRFTLWSREESSKKVADVVLGFDIVLQKVMGTTSMNVPWDDIQWTPFGSDMPLGVAAKIASNLDALIVSALDALQAASAQEATQAVTSLIERGEQQ